MSAPPSTHENRHAAEVWCSILLTAMAATNDKTSSVFVTKDAFHVAAKDVGLSTEVADALWAKLGDSSSQRIIGGATAPRQDASNVNNWHWSEVDLLPWCKERLEKVVVGVAGQGIPDKGWVKVTKMEKCDGEASAPPAGQTCAATEGIYYGP